MVIRKLFHKLLPLEVALGLIERKIELKPRGVEVVDIMNSLGRVLAKDIYADIDYPPFDRSEVDGYAVRAEDTYGATEYNPITLRVVGSVKVGEEPRYEVVSETAIEIATGAPIPRGCNAVVMEEYTRRRNTYVDIYRSVPPLENISITGSDVARGELVLLKGTKLGPFELGVLAALGISMVDVYLRPKAVVISVGDELAPPGKVLRFGQIYDYNGFAISAYLKSLGAEVDYLGIIPDDENKLRSILMYCLDKYDVVITSGGTSAGIEDVVYRVVESLGEIVVHGLETKPGKPTLVGIIQDKLVIGLPGFPFSAISTTLTLLRYIIEKLSGVEHPVIRYSVKAKIAQRVRKEVGKDVYLPVVITTRGSELIAIPIPYRSGSVMSILRANAIAIVRKGVELIDEGTEVDIIPLSLEIPEAVFIGSHDILLQVLLKLLGLTSRCRFIPTGSLAGLISIARGYGDVAPIHLLDPETSIYNKSYVNQFRDVVLVSGYKRRLVIAFGRGNPKNIKGIEDFLRNDIRIVNRNRGSGTRTYIDIMLGNLAKEMNMRFDELVRNINGYTYEVSTHTGVAAAIAQGRADVGICIEYVAKLYNLDYIPLAWEEYDFAINKHSLSSKPAIKTFIEFLRSDEFRKLLANMVGYQIKNDIGEVTCC